MKSRAKILLDEKNCLLVQDVCKAFSNLPLSGIADKLIYIIGKDITQYHFIYMGIIIGQMEHPISIASYSLN